MDLSFNIVQKGQTVQLELDGSTSLRDIAEFFHENQMTQSLDIGIYSQKKQYYTENQDEELQNIGTGSDDIYLILEGDLKDQYNPKSLNIIMKDIMIYLYIKNIISGNISKVSITVNPLMKVCELIKLIQTNYDINDVQLLKKRNWVNIELHKPQYQMQTLDKVGIKKSQTLDVQGKNIYKRYQELNIHIVDGCNKCEQILQMDLQTKTILDLKTEIEKSINLSPEFGSVDIFIDGQQFSRQNNLLKQLFTFNITKTTQIQAKIRYSGCCSGQLSNEQFNNMNIKQIKGVRMKYRQFKFKGLNRDITEEIHLSDTLSFLQQYKFQNKK